MVHHFCVIFLSFFSFVSEEDVLVFIVFGRLSVVFIVFLDALLGRVATLSQLPKLKDEAAAGQ